MAGNREKKNVVSPLKAGSDLPVLRRVVSLFWLEGYIWEEGLDKYKKNGRERERAKETSG